MSGEKHSPLGPLVGKVEEIANIGANIAASAKELGINAVENVVDYGFKTAKSVVEQSQNTVDTITEAGAGTFRFSKSKIKQLGGIATGLLPALGDRTTETSEPEES